MKIDKINQTLLNYLTKKPFLLLFLLPLRCFVFLHSGKSGRYPGLLKKDIWSYQEGLFLNFLYDLCMFIWNIAVTGQSESQRLMSVCSNLTLRFDFKSLSLSQITLGRVNLERKRKKEIEQHKLRRCLHLLRAHYLVISKQCI